VITVTATALPVSVAQVMTQSGRVHTDTSRSWNPSTVSLQGLARVVRYCKQCYIILCVCHNNDVIIDVKTFWYPFLLFSWQKQRNLHKNCSHFKVTRTCMEPILGYSIVNSCY